MKRQISTPRFYQKGFTLAESVIALGILVVLITGFMAVFGPAAQTIRRTLSIDEASRLEASLLWELSNVRAGREASAFEGDSFRKAFEWIANAEQQGETILVYKYRALEGAVRSDGTLEPAPRELGIAGTDFVVRPMVRRLSDPLIDEDLDAVDGRVFFVRLSQLIYEGEGLRVSDNAGEIVDPNNPSDDFSRTPGSYPEAVLAFEAEYYNLPSTSINFLRQAFDPADFTRPVFARNLAIRR